jgi:hypothetical protein
MPEYPYCTGELNEGTWTRAFAYYYRHPFRNTNSSGAWSAPEKTPITLEKNYAYNNLHLGNTEYLDKSFTSSGSLISLNSPSFFRRSANALVRLSKLIRCSSNVVRIDSIE